MECLIIIYIYLLLDRWIGRHSHRIDYHDICPFTYFLLQILSDVATMVRGA